MKINKKRPWLPQETPKPVAFYPELNEEFEEAKKRAALAQKEYERLKKLREKSSFNARPFTMDMITLSAQFDRARRERMKANVALRNLRDVIKRRKLARRKG
jgi:hypothetical protein